MIKIYVFIFVLLTAACSGLPESVRQSLELAGDNRPDLEKLLKEYRQHKADSLKFKAACFLIENMRWHQAQEQLEFTDPQLETFRHVADSTYYVMVRGMKNEDITTKEFRQELDKKRKAISDTVRNYKFQSPIVRNGVFPDIQTVNYHFLKSHIDNAFRMWEESPFARHLTFDEFCEYLLPYRSMSGESFYETGKKWNEIFGKYVHNGTGGGLRDYIQRYNLAVRQQREFQGKCPLKEPLGLYDLFFNGKHDCVGIADYGCNALRACGIPVAVEFNSAYRDFTNRHFHCVVLDSTGNWQTFNPESSLPGDGDWALAVTLNVYRFYFSAQKDSPYFLKQENEYVPGFMKNPCIRDVTAHLKEVFSTTLPFTPSTSNRLVYLATFQKNNEGLIPVTWGTVDTMKREVTFKNCLAGMLYFPVYYDEEKIRVFGEPFYLEKDSTVTPGYRVCHLSANSGEKGELVITRKFPRKSKMKQLAEELVGSRFLASNNWNYSDSVVIYTIRKAPIPYLQDFPLKNRKAYKYYRFIAPDEHPHANVSMLEFITEKSYNYTNTMPPTPLPVLHPNDLRKQLADRRRVKLLDAPSWDKMKWKAEYDGNMQTAPSAYKTVNFRLKEPQVVTRIRFAPKNADNGIKPGDCFELMYWDKDGWRSLGINEAQYEHLVFSDAPLNGLYWLRNLDRGKEELPFVMQNGEQKFIYYDILN